MLLACVGAVETNLCPPTVSTGKALTCFNSLPVCKKSFLTRKKHAINFCRLPRQIKTYSVGWTVRRALNTISDRNKTETY